MTTFFVGVVLFAALGCWPAWWAARLLNFSKLGAALLSVPLGIAMVMVAGGWYLRLFSNLDAFVPLVVVSAIASAAGLAFWLRRTQPGSFSLQRWKSELTKERVVIGAALVLFTVYIAQAVLPFTSDEFLYRVGIDTPAYIAAMRHLAVGGDAHTFDHPLAEMILQITNRVGLPIAAVAVDSLLSDTRGVAGIHAVPLLNFVFGTGFAACALFGCLKGTGWLPRGARWVAMLYYVVALLNSNVLCLLDRGFLPHFYGCTSVLLLLAIMAVYGSGQLRSWKTAVGVGLILGLLDAGLLFTFSESMQLFIVAAAGWLFFSYLCGTIAEYRNAAFVLVASGVFAVAFASPQVVAIVKFAKMNTEGITGPGYNMCPWLFPSDMAGLTSGFDDFLESVEPGSGSPRMLKHPHRRWCRAISIAMGLVLLWGIRRDRYRTMMLSCIGVVGLTFVVNRLLGMYAGYTKNYIYVKTAILFAPILTWLFFHNLASAMLALRQAVAAVNVPTWRRVWAGRLSVGACVALLLLSVTSTTAFLRDLASAQGSLETSAFAEIAAYVKAHPDTSLTTEPFGLVHGGVDPKVRFVHRTGDFLLYAFTGATVMCESDLGGFTEHDGQKRVLMLVDHRRDNLAKLAAGPSAIELASPRYTVLDTGKVVADLGFDEQGKPAHAGAPWRIVAEKERCLQHHATQAAQRETPRR